MPPTLYTEEQVRKYLQALYKTGKTYQQIADGYGPPINKADIGRAIKDGTFSKRPDKRAALSLVGLDLAPVCPIHGVVHRAKSCPGSYAGKRKRDWKRLALLLLLLHMAVTEDTGMGWSA